MELKEYDQWVCWKNINGKKVPINARTGAFADITDKSCFLSYEKCKEISEFQGIGIGFVLTKDDPFFCIDIDKDKDRKILKQLWSDFDTYTEKSPSGEGFHIWGKLSREKKKGLRKGSVEIYEQQRYITFTSNSIRDLEVSDKTQALDALRDRIESKPQREERTITREGKGSRDEVLNRIKESDQLTLFRAYYNGDWENLGYPSQSEADLSFCSMLSGFGASEAAIEEIWRESGMWREKCETHPYYMSSTIKKSMSRSYFIEDVSEDILEFLNNPLESNKKREDEKDERVSLSGLFYCQDDEDDNEYLSVLEKLWDKSDGIIKFNWNKSLEKFGNFCVDLAKFQSRYIQYSPVVVALSWIAAQGGMTYSVDGMGLNMYNIILSKSGTGKEGISVMMGEIEKSYESFGITPMFRGPGKFVSHQGIRRALEKTPSCVSIINEFGLFFSNYLSANGKNTSSGVKDILLEAFSKSAGGVLDGIVYSSEENNIGKIKSPALSLIGETTPDTFFPFVDQESLLSGFIPRSIIWENLDPRSGLNRKAHLHKLSSESLGAIESVAVTTHYSDKDTIVDVKVLDEAAALFDALDKLSIKKQDNEIESIVLSRIEAKAKKVASCIAIFNSPLMPEIDYITALFSIEILIDEAKGVYERISKRRIGNFYKDGNIDVLSKAIYETALAHKLEKKEHFISCGLIRLSEVFSRAKANIVAGKYLSEEAVFVQTVDNMARIGMLEKADRMVTRSLKLRGEFVYASKEILKGNK